MTRVGVYDEISPEPSGNPSGSALRISLGLRRYFIVYPSSRHNTVTVVFGHSPLIANSVEGKVGGDCGGG